MKTMLTGALALAAAVLGPAIAAAATFAYVDQAGDVRTVVADTPNAAIMTAPNIDEHSGVLLLDDAADNEVVGDDVPGV